MEDIYLEYLIKKKKDGKQMTIIAAIIAGAVIVSAALLVLVFALAFAAVGTSFGSFIFSIGLVLIAMAWYGAYLLINMQNIEYEYILTNSELDIDKVLSKKGRKSFVSFDFKNIITCAAVDDNEHNSDYKNITPDKTYDAIGDRERGNIYFADFQDDNGRNRVLFQPTSKMIQAAWKFNPRNIFVTE